MRILVINNYYPEHYGGIEFVTHNLVIRYRQTGHQVRWMASDVKKYPHVCHPDDVPLSAWNVTEETLNFPYPIPDINNLKAIIEHVRWCDVIHLHGCLYLSNVLTFWLSRLMRKPVLITQHVKEIPYQQVYKRVLQRLAYKLLGRWLLSRVEYVVFYSLTVQNWFTRFIPFHRPPQFIANGVDMELFHPNTPDERQALRVSLGLKLDKPMFLFVGRFAEKKGIRLLRPIIEKNSNWNWVLVGRLESENPITWNLPNVMVLPPMPQRQLQAYYAVADLLILPSVGEGFPLAVQESMACGTPVLLCEETVQAIPEGHELFFTVQPQITSIREQLQQAMADPVVLQYLRNRVRQFACAEWSWDVG